MKLLEIFNWRLGQIWTRDVLEHGLRFRKVEDMKEQLCSRMSIKGKAGALGKPPFSNNTTIQYKFYPNLLLILKTLSIQAFKISKQSNFLTIKILSSNHGFQQSIILNLWPYYSVYILSVCHWLWWMLIRLCLIDFVVFLSFHMFLET